MLIVKPYGRTETAADTCPATDLRRTLRLNPGLGGMIEEIRSFARDHPELLLAQWISAIDRIATKPRAGRKPTTEQRNLRQKLGAAAWEILSGMIPADRKEVLERLWWRKIHPYGEDVDRKGKARAQGRWYARFAGSLEPKDICEDEAGKIARKIKEHLHRTEYRIHGSLLNKAKGRIAARAESIERNVISPVGKLPEAEWTKKDECRYKAKDDIALEIRKAAEALETDRRRVGPAVAAKALYAHYGKLFDGEDGGALAVDEARNLEPGLFALHMAVRETYTRILKNHRRRSVSTLLPGDMNALFRLARAMGQNRELNALVRLGKLIHYQAAPAPNEPAAVGDEPVYAVERWPNADAIGSSRYRTSAGQSEIKRNEAFVRIWRGAVALAQRTLTDWADPEGKIDRDILLGGQIEQAVEKGFDEGEYRRKLSLLFGSRAALFDGVNGQQVLRLALEGWAGLRNNSFHFVGRGGFDRALREGTGKSGTGAMEPIRELLAADRRERRARLVESLRAAHVEHYYVQEHVASLLAAVTRGASAQSPLPRFRRILARADNAWRRGKFHLSLPGPENRRDMGANPGRLARYVALKTLYERAFPPWLEARDAGTLNGWIDLAGTRATAAAQAINRDRDAAARMAGLVRLAEGEGIADFTDRLAAQSASEYRVQRGYESDPAAARKQAKHIEDLRCDVVGQAFEAYLKEAEPKLAWTLDDPSDGPLPEKKKADLKCVALPEEADAGEKDDRLARLYFLLHMLPVEAAGGLRHQLRKWSVLEPDRDADVKAVDNVEAVERIFELYLDMHDAKFEGGDGVAGAEALEGLFVHVAQFRRVCPEGGAGGDSHVPWRGLREMLRFGGGEPRLMWAFGKHLIQAVAVDRLEGLEKEPAGGGLSPVAKAHKLREDLHAKWAKKKSLSRKDKEAYGAALETVVQHRHLAAHVGLVNHARLHRLAMAVLARLADYAGLWERDLYFATLALIRLRESEPGKVFSSTKLEDLKNGQIVFALRKDWSGGETESEDKKKIKEDLRRLFGEDFLGNEGKAGIRNELMHFETLKRGKNEPFSLTQTVNDTRRLMAYDRKLKNAVSRSIIELLAREGLDLAWKMKDHELADATLKSRQAVHLGGAEADGMPITEDLHGREFVAMAAALFGGKALPAAAAKEGPDGGERKGGSAAARAGRPAKAQLAPPSSPLPAAGGRVEAVLLEEKTRKGGWKAAAEADGRRIVGDIYNSREVPKDVRPGQKTELVVRIANPANASFEWPSPDVEQRLAAKAAAPRRGGRPGGKRR